MSEKSNLQKIFDKVANAALLEGADYKKYPGIRRDLRLDATIAAMIVDIIIRELEKKDSNKNIPFSPTKAEWDEMMLKIKDVYKIIRPAVQQKNDHQKRVENNKEKGLQYLSELKPEIDLVKRQNQEIQAQQKVQAQQNSEILDLLKKLQAPPPKPKKKSLWTRLQTWYNQLTK